MSSLVPGVNDMHNRAIDNLVQSSYVNRLGWIPCKQITKIESTQIDNAYYAVCQGGEIMLLLLGSREECTPTLVSEFARIYSLPTHNYNNDDVNQFRRYEEWLECRNNLIKGFTKYEDNYYMVADERFYHYYSRYG